MKVSCASLIVAVSAVVAVRGLPTCAELCCCVWNLLSRSLTLADAVAACLPPAGRSRRDVPGSCDAGDARFVAYGGACMLLKQRTTS